MGEPLPERELWENWADRTRRNRIRWGARTLAEEKKKAKRGGGGQRKLVYENKRL